MGIEHIVVARELTREQQNIKNQLQVLMMLNGRDKKELTLDERNALAVAWRPNSEKFRIVFDTLLTDPTFDLVGMWKENKDELQRIIGERMAELSLETNDSSTDSKEVRAA